MVGRTNPWDTGIVEDSGLLGDGVVAGVSSYTPFFNHHLLAVGLSSLGIVSGLIA